MKKMDKHFILCIIILFITYLKRTHCVPQTEDSFPTNNSDHGSHLGANCVTSCSVNLLHVYCNPRTNICQCEKNYPVKLNPYVGCSKPKRLGDQCYYVETCQYTDQYSSCIQIHHNAVCQCIKGYHSVSIQKPSMKMFCSKDLVIITTDFSTFIGVLAGIAVLTGLICFTLHLFNQTLYENHHQRFRNTNLIPTTLFADNTGSRRPSYTSVHSSISINSYSSRRYERELEQKEEKEMKRRLSKIKASTVGTNTDLRSPDNTLEENQYEIAHLAKEESMNLREELPSTSNQSF